MVWFPCYGYVSCCTLLASLIYIVGFKGKPIYVYIHMVVVGKQFACLLMVV